MAVARYAGLARLLGPEQLGLASTLVVTSAFFDQVTDTGSERFLIQDKSGDDPVAQRLVHLVLVGRGLIIASCLALAAPFIASLYRAPQLSGALVILALCPLAMGFLHGDMRRVQRRLDFRAESIAALAAEAVSVVVMLTVAWVTRSYFAVLYGLIARALVMVIVSHLTAERKYGVGFSRQHAKRLMQFSIPLLANGVLLFLGSQGDRVLVSNRAGLAALGQYSAVLLLIYYPSGILLRYIQSMYLPKVAAARDDPVEYARTVGMLGGQTLLLGLLMSASFAVVAPTAVYLLFGRKFVIGAHVVALIGVLQTTRFAIIWPMTMAMGLGRSGAILASNCVRLAAYPAALLGVRLAPGLDGIVGGFIAGELAGVAGALMIVNRSVGNAVFWGAARVGKFMAGSSLILAGAYAYDDGRPIWALAGLGAAAVLVVSWIVRTERPAIQAMLDVVAATWAGARARLRLQSA